MNQSNQRIARNTLFLYVRFAIVMIANLYVTRVVLEVLGASDFGLYNVVCGFVAMFGFLNTSMTNGIQRFYNYELGKNGDESIVKVYNTAIFIQLILAMAILLLTETIGLWYVNNLMVVQEGRLETANWIFQFSIISLILVIMQVPYSAAIMAYERMDYYAIVSVVEILLKVISILLLPYMIGDSLIIYGAMIVVITVITFLMYYVYCCKNFVFLRWNKTLDSSLFKSMIGFSGWNILGSFAYLLKGQGTNVLINAFFGTVVNAANGIAAQVSSAIQSFSANLLIAFKPQLTQSYAIGDYLRTEQLMFSMSKISYILMNLLSIPIIVEINCLLNLWLGNDVPEYTNIFAVLTIVAMMIGIFNTPVTQVVHAIGKMKSYQITTSLIIGSILPISYLFFKLGFEANTIYIVTIIITMVNQLFCLIVLHSIFKFNVMKYICQVILPCMGIAIVTVFVALLITMLMSSSILRVFVVFAINAVTTIVVSYLMLNRHEKNAIRNYIIKYAKK